MRTPLVLTLVLVVGMACAHRPSRDEPLPPGPPAPLPQSPVDSEMYRGLMANLRQADAFASEGKIEEANAIYRLLANTPEAPREILVGAAVGLYRTGAFGDSAAAFRRLGVFGRGEEDLRYYYAVALYESGSFAEARKELACALPYIEKTEGVERYRIRIEGTAQQARRGRGRLK